MKQKYLAITIFAKSTKESINPTTAKPTPSLDTAAPTPPMPNSKE